MNKIFRQVSVKERLPEKYPVIFITRNNYPHLYGGHYNTDEGYLKITFDYWLEEIELPTDKDIRKRFYCEGLRKVHAMQHCWNGAEWMRDFILDVTPKDKI